MPYRCKRLKSLFSEKGASEFISGVLMIFISFMGIALVIAMGLPALNRAKEAAAVNEATQNMRELDSVIREVASEGTGALRSMIMKVSDGSYAVNGKADTVDFAYEMKYGLMERGTFYKEGNLYMMSGATAKASEYDVNGDGTTELVLENEILRVGIQKIANSSSPNTDTIDSKDSIKLLNFKENMVNVTPSDTSLILDGMSNTSSGNGYSEIIKKGDYMSKAEALVHINSTEISYDVVYTLYSSADFLIVKVINAYYNSASASSSRPTYVKYRMSYHLNTSNANNVYRIDTNDIANQTVNNTNINNLQYVSNLTHYDICSYNNIDYAGGMLLALIHSYKSSYLDYINFTSTSSSADYTLELRNKPEGGLLLLVYTKGTCQLVHDKMQIVETQGIPSKPLATFSFSTPGSYYYEISATYDKININGTDSWTTGTNVICVEKTTVTNQKPVVYVRRC